ncbi:MAG: toll/interleukin-1 receptor domain-containing protein [candidate division WOR-3 bacterium]
MKPPRLFISFSSRDVDFVRRLFNSLKSQGAEVWDYSRREEGITPGHDIPEVLRRQIDGSDYFITVVSRNSMDPAVGRFVRLELEHALSCGMLGQGRIIPVVLLDRVPESWRGPHKQLETTLHLDLRSDDARQYDDLIVRICRLIAIPYSPPYLGDLRLPFAKRFQDELREVITSPALYDELAVAADDFARKFAAHQWQEADEAVGYIFVAARYKLPETRLYFPLIARAICQLQMGRFGDAEELLMTAIQHPRKDENSYGALGQLYFRSQRYEEALQAFERALELCPPDERLELQFNILGTRIQLGQIPDGAEVLAGFDRAALDPDELAEVEKMEAIVKYKQGRLNQALTILDRLRSSGRDDPAAAVYAFLCLSESGRRQEALDRLRADARRLDDTILHHYLASFCLSIGEHEEGLRIFREVLCAPGRRTRQFMVEYARALTTLGRSREAGQVCRQVLSREFFRAPATAEDFFYDGFANYLLGHGERARYDYERSAGFCKVYYDELMRQQVAQC